MSDWKTTIFGIIAAAAGGVAAASGMPAIVHQVAIIAATIAGSLFAFFAKDK